jgi:hypothetical protein
MGRGFAGPCGRVSDAPAAPLGRALPPNLNDINDLAKNEGPSHIDWTAGPEGPGPEKLNEIKGLGPDGVAGRPENGAPSRPVTGTPNHGAHSELLGGAHSGLLGLEGTTPLGGSEKGAPFQSGQVPGPVVENRPIKNYDFPPAEDLF